MLWIIIGTIGSYLLGSIPTAYIFGRIIKGTDIRKFGSGNVGATNAMRLLGKPAGIIVLLLDVLKGFAATFFWADFIAARTELLPGLIPIIFGFCCICGHNWTIFLRFKGGKGVATSLGVLIGLAINTDSLRLIIVLALVVWAAVFLLTRIVSISSIATGVCLPILMIILRQPPILTFLILILSLILILRHKPNLQRLLRNQEKKLF